MITLEGIVIARRDVGESSCFLDLLTEELGVIEVSARGVKKLNNSNSSATSLFSLGLFCVVKRGEIYTLNSSTPKYSFHKLSQDIEGFSLAVYFADIIKYSASSEEFQGELLQFFAMSLYKIEQGIVPLVLIKGIFELKLMAMIGFLPELRYCVRCGNPRLEKAYFSPISGGICCGNCYDGIRGSEHFTLTPSVVQSLRFIIYSPIEKVYSFSLGEESISLLSKIAEVYLHCQLGRSFKSLDYYKNIMFTRF